MSKTAVVILNWNGEALLKKFLPVVVENSEYPNVEIIVADNASTDNSVAFVEKNFSKVGLIQLDKNYGFAGGYNKALQQVEADYYLLLNSDVAPEADWLGPLIKEMDAEPNLGACMPKIRAYNEPDKFEYAGASGGYIDLFGYPFCRGRILNSIESDNGQYNEPLPVFWASGAALMIRSELYLKAGGLDEAFFAHMEEIDLCWRIKNMGLDIKILPSSEVLHVGGATLSQQNAKKTFLNFRNNLLMLVKNLPSKRLLPILFIRMVLDGIAGLHFISKGEFRHFMAVLKAHFSFYAKLPYVCRLRKQQASFRVKNAHKEIYPQSIIWAFYIKGLRRFSELKHYHLD
ncbi:glycosyltransferase family 2 protein [Carboxylicivirga sp. A043]|uniref:glycosyltransferase family 2 protein n=1 Tax=Carboxylicivirga litoralis TaxID=2816963 RepID=UPI0021CB7597|nr:glycosyltransferase family 2 protein [Carboxylicivirga sp. A043]MCU4155002.1 glycosyltransferase family 2 protein [Carboxylicivirga sp. A043]